MFSYSVFKIFPKCEERYFSQKIMENTVKWNTKIKVLSSNKCNERFYITIEFTNCLYNVWWPYQICSTSSFEINKFIHCTGNVCIDSDKNIIRFRGTANVSLRSIYDTRNIAQTWLHSHIDKIWI